MTNAAIPQPDEKPVDPVKRNLRQNIRQNYLVMSSARLDSALATDSPFVERLVHFWANHFAVSVDKLPVIGLAGLLEFEAIRPHVLGKFSRHAARCRAASGDARSISTRRSRSAPTRVRANSRPCAADGKRGLNENLAREIMELHTLGVRTGYTQADVTEFARALTGWTVGGIGRGPGARMLGNAPAGEFHVRRVAARAGRPDDPGPAATARMARRRRERCLWISRPVRRRRSTSRPSSRAISPATSRRRRWSTG